jgi:predicted lactoylglutathione lyase
MIAFALNSIEEVNRLYNKAIELGWIDDGKPWTRWDSGFYAWYFRDLDGNKLNFYHVANK